MSYTNALNSKEVLPRDFNTKITVIKNINKESNNCVSLPNTSIHVINETGKVTKKEIPVAKRKFHIIKTEKRPVITPYNYSFSNRLNLSNIPINLNEKKNVVFRGTNNNQ